MNMQQMLKKAQELQRAMTKKLKEFEEVIHEFKYKEYVTIKIKGSLEIQSIDINKAIIDPEDAEMLGDIITAALNEAIAKIEAEKEKITASMTPTGMGGLF